MISGNDLFGRQEISPFEKKIIKNANKTALSLFRRRFSPDLRDNWDKNVNELTLQDVESIVIEAILKADGTGGKKLCHSRRENLATQKEIQKATC